MNRLNPWLLLLLIGLLSAATQALQLPWWTLAVVAYLGGLGLARTGKAAFWAGFGGAALSWLIPAAWLAQQNNGLLAHRMAQLLPLGGSVPALILVDGLVAGLVGGMAALAGAWLLEAFRPTRMA